MSDMNNMKKLSNYGQLTPEAWNAFNSFNDAVFAEGEVSTQIKELIAVAVAVTTQCGYCIEIHTQKAKETGNSEKAIAEAVMVAAALRAGGAVTHGTHCMG